MPGVHTSQAYSSFALRAPTHRVATRPHARTDRTMLARSLVFGLVATLSITISSVWAQCSGNAGSGTAAAGAPFWQQTIAHQGKAPYAPAGYQVFRNVKDFGAKGTTASRVDYGQFADLVVQVTVLRMTLQPSTALFHLAGAVAAEAACSLPSPPPWSTSRPVPTSSPSP